MAKSRGSTRETETQVLRVDPYRFVRAAPICFEHGVFPGDWLDLMTDLKDMAVPPYGMPDLEAIRKQRGITLVQIAEATKIRLPYLEAIEKGELEKLPAGVYARSYLRQYAQAIDSDESELLRSIPIVIEPEDEPVPEPTLLRRLVRLVALAR